MFKYFLFFDEKTKTCVKNAVLFWRHDWREDDSLFSYLCALQAAIIFKYVFER